METCPHCGKPIVLKTVKVLGMDFVTKVGCSCEREQALQKKQAKELKYRQQESYAWSDISKRMQEYELDNFITNNDDKVKLLEKINVYLKNFAENKKHGIGLILSGNVGTGKTFLAVSIFKKLVRQGYFVIFSKATNLFTRMEEAKSFNNPDTISHIVHEYCQADLLILDDLGSHIWNDSVNSYLYKIIDSRYENMKPTIITTNCSKQDLAIKLGERIKDRLSNCLFLTTNDDSMRGKIAQKIVNEINL